MSSLRQIYGIIIYYGIKIVFEGKLSITFYSQLLSKSFSTIVNLNPYMFVIYKSSFNKKQESIEFLDHNLKHLN